MAGGPNAEVGDRSDWLWVPNSSYGPFAFGAHRTRTPHVGSFIEETDMGSKDVVADYESERGDVELTFWNDYLTGVGAEDTFVIGSAELIGADFNDVRRVVPEVPVLSNHVVILVADFDAHNMMWFMTMDWRITSVKVGIDPDTVPD